MEQTNSLLLKEQLCFPFYAVSRMITRMYQPWLDNLNLTYPQYLVMMVLWESDHQSVSSIGKRLYLNSNTLTPLLKKLTDKGFVEKKRSQSDEREVYIQLTSEGKSLKNKAEHIPYSLVEEINIPNEDLLKMRTQMWDFLNAFNPNLKD